MNYDQHDTPEPTPIANVEAEAALLGGLMLDNRLVDTLPSLAPDEFHDPFHQRLYRTIVHVHNTGSAANPITLRPYFVNDPPIRYWTTKPSGARVIETVSVQHYMAQLTGSGAAIVGARDFAEQIRDLATMRQIAATMQAGITDISALSDESSIAEIASDIVGKIITASERVTPVKVKSGASAFQRARERMANLKSGTAPGAQIRTIPDLNDLLGSLEGKKMTIIGGRPSMGKSVLAHSIGWGCAANQHPTLLLSYEMSEEALALRTVADITHGMGEPVPYKVLLSGKGLTPTHQATMLEAERRMEEIPFHTLSPSRGTIEELEARVTAHAAMLARQGKRLQVLIVDYIQLLSTTKKMDRTEVVSHISGRLLELAKRLDLHVIVLSQLNRKVEERPDKRPQSSDLKESGRLEEDADNVLLVYREEFYLNQHRVKEGQKGHEEWFDALRASRGLMTVIATKVRAGEPDSIPLKFIGASQAVRSNSWFEPMMGEKSDLI